MRRVSNTIEKLSLYTEVLRLGDHAANYLNEVVFISKYTNFLFIMVFFINIFVFQHKY